MLNDTSAILKQFEPIELLYQEIMSGTDGSHSDKIHKYYMLCRSCVSRVSGHTSDYVRQLDVEMNKPDGYDHEVSENGGRSDTPIHVRPLYGIVQALKADVTSGYLTTLRELVHTELFSDLLDGANYFLGEGHKDAAAVLAGGVLENHLRLLCHKYGVSLESLNHKGDMKPKMGDVLNTDLVKAGAYNTSLQKQVLAWQGLRNSAAHGKYADYTADQVRLFLDGVRHFIVTNPA